MNLQKNGWLAAILVLAFLLRIPGVFWGELYKGHLVVLEPDEFQHVDLTIEILQKVDSSIFSGYHPVRYNALGFSTQLSIPGYFLVKIFGSEYKVLLLAGRLLSLLYGVLLVWLVYRLSLFIFSDEKVAMWTAGFLAIFDLGVTNSHYAVPEIPYTFWACLSIFLIFQFMHDFEKGQARQAFLWKKWAFACFAMAMTMAVKFDFIPFVFFALLIDLACFEKKISMSRAIVTTAITGLALAVFFFVCIGFRADFQYLAAIINWLADENDNLIAKDQHWLHNPVLYLAGTVAGIGVPATLLAFFGAKKIPRFLTHDTKYLLLLAAFLTLEFLVLWKLDSPFVRRCGIFLPFLALLAGFGADKLWTWKGQTGKWVVITIGGYTLLLTLVSQWNFVKDNRYEARDWLQQSALAGKKTWYSPFADINGIREEAAIREEAEVLVIHEAYYSRYGKSFATPFKIPECCEEVYHCKSVEECTFFQSLLTGETGFDLVKKTTPLDVFPERLLFKNVFGTYETFLGDMLIFEKGG